MEICFIKPEILNYHVQKEDKKFQVGGPSGLQVYISEWALSPGAWENMPSWLLPGSDSKWQGYENRGQLEIQVHWDKNISFLSGGGQELTRIETRGF